MTLSFGPFRYADARYVAEHMRAADREEIAATREDDANPEGVALDCEKSASYSWIAYLDDEPIMVVGFMPLGPKVMSGYMLATDRLSEVGLGATKWALRVGVQFLRELGCHRVECHSLSTHSTAHKWLRALGAHVESEVPNFGKNGETFFRFVRLF